MSSTPRRISSQWGCRSTNPGTMVLPLRSKTFACGGTVTEPRRPRAVMRLPVTTMSASGITSSPRMVMTCAPRRTTTPVGWYRGCSIETGISWASDFLSSFLASPSLFSSLPDAFLLAADFFLPAFLADFFSGFSSEDAFSSSFSLVSSSGFISGSKETVESGWRKNVEPTAQVTVEPPSAQAM